MITELLFLAVICLFWPESKIEKAYEFDSYEYINDSKKEEKYGDHLFNVNKCEPLPSK